MSSRCFTTSAYNNLKRVRTSCTSQKYNGNFKTPRSTQQELYVEALSSSKSPIVIGTGPAGCGKTLFACQEASNKYYEENKKIIITRPTVGVDEELGYLPGNLESKMSPWMVPVFDMLKNSFSSYNIEKMMNNGMLEICPLSYMRGRTFENCFVIADEMQNSTANQLKMILTRVGCDTKLVVLGDPDQTDLDSSKGMNGLLDLMHRLDKNTEEYDTISHVKLSEVDIQRHQAVIDVLKLYK